jgi:hypothetical protein
LLLRLVVVSIQWQSFEPPPHIPTTLGVVPVLPAEDEEEGSARTNKALGDKSKKKPKKKKKNKMTRAFPSEK